MKKMKRCISIIIMVSLIAITLAMSAMSVSAATVKITLSKTAEQAETAPIGLYKSAYCELYNSVTSNDGVNCYLKQSEPGKSWKTATHIFCEPGETMISKTCTYNTKRTWKIILNSWWLKGKNNLANGSMTAY